MSRYERKPVLIKLLTLFNYWSNQMGKLIAAVKYPCLNDGNNFHPCVNFWQFFLSSSNKKRKISSRENKIVRSFLLQISNTLLIVHQFSSHKWLLLSFCIYLEHGTYVNVIFFPIKFYKKIYFHLLSWKVC